MKPTAPLLPLALALLTLTGCVTRGYQLADKDVPAAVPLNLTSAPIMPADPLAPTSSGGAPETRPPAVEATLDTVIVYQGPGSWKREAYWDEYVISIRNPGAVPLVVTAASLHDGESDALSPGDKPWAIEKLSKKWWETNAARQAGTYLVLGAGAAGGATLAAANFMIWGGGSAVSTAFTAGAAVAVLAPVIAGGTIYMNVHRKHQVEAEFTRRRLVLPLTLKPGQTAQGSLFFRITPSPQRLALQCRADSGLRDVVIDLAPLAGLHLKSAPAVTASSPSRP